MNAAALLARLERVKQTGPGRWMARCPAHEDKSPSLSIRETDNGNILVHCFSGCAAADVVAALGLELSDLFPERLDHHISATRDRKHHHAALFALKALQREALIVATGAENIANGVALTDGDRKLLIESARRIREAAEVCQ